MTGDELGLEEELGRDYYRLIWISHKKRDALENLTRRNLRLKSYLTVASGILSLISSATIAAIVVAYVPSKYLSILALLLALLGGLLALIGSFAYNYRELFNLHLGASKFLELRERASRFALDRQLTYNTRKQRLSELWEEYTTLSAMYDHYAKVGEPPTTPTYQTGFEIAERQLGEEQIREIHKKLFDEFEGWIKRLEKAT